MTSRIVFDASFLQAIRVRGLTLTELAQRAYAAVATASSAVHGHQVKVATALRLARVVSATPVVPELEAWTRSPASVRDAGVDSGVSDPEE